MKYPWHHPSIRVGSIERWSFKPAFRHSLLIVLALIIVPVGALAQSSIGRSVLESLPVSERVALNSGQPVVTGEKGQYVGKVLITAPLAIVWRVLTDYEGGVKYMPNLVSSRILEVKGNQKVIEQVSARRVLTFKVKSRLRTLVSESEPKRIDFRLIEGDLKQLQGFWQIEPIAPRSGKLPTQFLLTYQVMAQPSGSTPKGIFHNIFKNSLPETLKAVRGEIERRSR